MFKKSSLVVSLFIFLIFLGAYTINNSPLVGNALAQGQLIPRASGEDCRAGDATYCGNYILNDFIALAINVARLILGLVGSLTLIMFVYGGIMFLISGGSSEKVAKAKNILVAAVVGLIIVFSSWLIVRFVTDTLGTTERFTGSVNIE